MVETRKLPWERMAIAAWEARAHAFVYEGTKVGSALVTQDGRIYAGCNIEQRFRNKDMHAEMSAMNQMVVAGEKRIMAIIVVAERERFTPCGCCMDWIYQFADGDCEIAFQNKPAGSMIFFTAREIMPIYPR